MSDMRQLVGQPLTDSNIAQQTDKLKHIGHLSR
jgi:hypothetical protein